MTGRRLALLALVGGALCGLAAPAPAAAAGTCTNVSATRLQAGTLAPDGSALTPPIGDWEQISAQCSPAASTVQIHVPDCQPGCGPPSSNHRQIVEWWAHAPSACTPSAMPNANDTLTCPGKADGRICIYLRKSPGPDAPTAISSESLHVVFPDTSTFDATPALDAAAAGCGPGDHPANTVAPSISGTPRVGQPITCDPGTWTGDPPLTPTYQWRKNGVPIPGATSDTYTPTDADQNDSITCDVTMTNPEHDTTTATSAPVTIQPPSSGGGGGGPTGGGSGGGIGAGSSTCKLHLEKSIETTDGSPSVGFFPKAGVHKMGANEYAVSVGTRITFEIRVVVDQGPCPELDVRDLLPPDFAADSAHGELPPKIPAFGEHGETLTGAEFRQTNAGEEVSLPVPPLAGRFDEARWRVAGRFTKVGDQLNQARLVTPFVALSNRLRVHVVTRESVDRVKAGASGVSGDVRNGTAGGAVRAPALTSAAAAPSVALSRPTRVDVAVRRLNGKGAHSCLWLRNTHAGFTQTKKAGGACNSPVWLKARGTKHWSMRFQRPLPRGRYLAEARVTDVAGVASDPARSRRQFKVG